MMKNDEELKMLVVLLEESDIVTYSGSDNIGGADWDD